MMDQARRVLEARRRHEALVVERREQSVRGLEFGEDQRPPAEQGGEPLLRFTEGGLDLPQQHRDSSGTGPSGPLAAVQRRKPPARYAVVRSRRERGPSASNTPASRPASLRR